MAGRNGFGIFRRHPPGATSRQDAGINVRQLIGGRRRHLIAGTVAVVVGFAMLLAETPPVASSPTESLQQGDRVSRALPIPPLSRPDPAPLPELSTAHEDSPSPSLPADQPAANTDGDDQAGWIRITVKPGQTLAAIFADLGLTARDVHNVVHVDERTRKLTRLYPGDTLRFRLAEDGALEVLEFQYDESTRLRIVAQPQGLTSETIAADLEVRVQEASGVIHDSLFLAGRRAGITDALILELAHLFGWDIDFILDIRDGDSFHVLYEEVWRDGEFLRTGDILAATFINQGQKFQAVRFETEGSVGYYSPDGRNMKKAFLRAPLNFSYVSSSFNPRRFHPILKRVKAHNGIDYRAPSGTPVFAAGDGRVIRSSYTAANGHHVFIKHPNGVVTKYLHFTKRAVKDGERVTQGQVIGYVGATGLATAPHLHYEFIVNGVHRNPATVELPKADPLPPEELVQFQVVASPMLAQLDRLQAETMLATAE